MITEKHFSLSHAAFWHQLLPMTDSFIRECNTEAARFLDPLETTTRAGQRGIVNEVGFRLFAASAETSQSVTQLPPAAVDDCIANAILHVSQMRQLHRAPVSPLDAEGLTEAHEIAERLEKFFVRANLPSVKVFPIFPGCGWLDGCRGDILSDRVLFEVKAGDRSFRGSDLRQLLCYCALNFASKTHEIIRICLVNPRSGRFISETVERVAQRLAGRPAVEVLADIVEYVSEPPGRYATV